MPSNKDLMEALLSHGVWISTRALATSHQHQDWYVMNTKCIRSKNF